MRVIHFEPNLIPSKIRGKVNVECLKVRFVYTFFYKACLLSSMCCARDHAIKFGWVMGFLYQR